MQRLPLAVRCVLRSNSSLLGARPAAVFAPPVRAYANTPTAADVKQPKPDLHHAQYFKLERSVFVATLPLLPLSYFVHGTAMDWILTAAIIANAHFGAHAVITDYARPVVIGENWARIGHYATYIVTALLTAALVSFNYNDVGLTRAFELVFSL
ncbi:Succinate dehydrogenase [ubiquinone] cytochrome b small subunit [Aphelenchoides fujianensis]|nr:Succinate dehydrogenase [ubiquinone] cytochrome b small subunit [Aphelenchoides fujianensis]